MAMRFCLAVVCVALVVCVTAVEFQAMETHETIPDHYIAVFHPHLTELERLKYLGEHKSFAESDPHSEIKNTFAIGTLSGYAGEFSNSMLRSILNDSAALRYVQRDIVVSIAAPVTQDIKLDPDAGFDNDLEHRTHSVQLNPTMLSANITKTLSNGTVHGAKNCFDQSNAVWGLVRSSQRDRKLNGEYYFDTLGADVDAYVIDTGIYTGHSQFGGRARFGVSFTGETHQSDQNGHGTHCAGTIGAENYGIAKNANLVGVQVLSSTGSGYMSWVVSGVSWVCDAYKASTSGNKCVVNLSLGGGYYNTLNEAVNNLVKCGCTVVVAAGNDGADACSYSPAAAKNAITVGASDNADIRAYFSNYGSCVDIFAPGVYITSTWIGSAYAINTISGTSMAAPHVAGVAAKVVSLTGSTGKDVNTLITSAASSGYLSSVGSGSPNLLLYAACS
eukprot:m.169162 g.169162  ORF g.169162 m.169162 type:complete len:446 (-) comp31554_c0_seq1:210-1547(-)